MSWRQRQPLRCLLENVTLVSNHGLRSLSSSSTLFGKLDGQGSSVHSGVASSGAWDAAAPIAFWQEGVKKAEPVSVHAPKRTQGFPSVSRATMLAGLLGGLAAYSYFEGEKQGSGPGVAGFSIQDAMGVVTDFFRSAFNRAQQSTPKHQPEKTPKPEPAPAAPLKYSEANKAPSEEFQSSSSDSDVVQTTVSSTGAGEAQVSSTNTATLTLQPPSDVNGTANSDDEPHLEPSTHQRLQGVLDELTPLLERANAALIAASLDTNEQSQEALSSVRQPLPGKLSSAAKLMQEQVLRTENFMGLQHDVSASGLVGSNPYTADGSPAAVGAATRQAVADLESFQAVLQQVLTHHNREMTGATEEAQHWEAAASSKVAAAAAALNCARDTLDAQAESAERSKDAALQLQELNLAVRFETAANQERMKRLQLVDDVRMDVNAVQLASKHAQEKLRESAKHHQQAAAVAQLCEALHAGKAVPAATAAQLSDGSDELVSIALQSVPQPAVETGASTLQDLQQKWPVIRRSIRVDKALSSQEKTGFVSTCLAVVNAASKVSEGAALEVGQQKQSLEAQLAAADSAMKGGDIIQALEILEQVRGELKVDATVDKYMQALKSRAILDQSTALLHAHQAVLATAT